MEEMQYAYQERECDQPQQGRSILDQTKRCSPDHDPDEEGRYRKEIMPRNAGEEREGDGNATDIKLHASYLLYGLLPKTKTNGKYWVTTQPLTTSMHTQKLTSS